MSLGPHLISIPCYFNSSPLIHFTCQVSTISVIHHSWIISYILSKPLCIYTYIRTCISSQQSYSNKFQPSKSNQTTKQCPVSPNPPLRPKGLAQARRSRSGGTPSPRRGLEGGTRSQRGILLRRVPSRLGEMFARSKVEQVAWATFCAKRVWASPCLSRLGKTGSLGQVYQVSPLFSCNSHSHQLNPTNHCVHS